MRCRLKIGNTEYDCEGTSEEIARFAKELASTGLNTISINPIASIELAPLDSEDIKLPSYKEILRYIESKKPPLFEHTFVEIMKHFLNRQLGAWGETEGKYNTLYHKMKEAQRLIEKKYKGKFTSTIFKTKNGNGRIVRHTTYRLSGPGS